MTQERLTHWYVLEQYWKSHQQTLKLCPHACHACCKFSPPGMLVRADDVVFPATFPDQILSLAIVKMPWATTVAIMICGNDTEKPRKNDNSSVMILPYFTSWPLMRSLLGFFVYYVKYRAGKCNLLRHFQRLIFHNLVTSGLFILSVFLGFWVRTEQRNMFREWLYFTRRCEHRHKLHIF